VPKPQIVAGDWRTPSIAATEILTSRSEACLQPDKVGAVGSVLCLGFACGARFIDARVIQNLPFGRRGLIAAARSLINNSWEEGYLWGAAILA